MVRKVLFAILIGVILTSGWAYATVCDKEEAKSENRYVITAKVVDETYGVRDNEVHQFDAQRTPWVRHGSKAVVFDTIAWFSAEGPSWNDEVMVTPWDKIDATDIPSTWHVDDFKVCSDDSAWWSGDPSIGSQGGYLDDWWQQLDTPAIVDISDSTFLIYDQWLKCEPGEGSDHGWDGYQVRVSTDYPGFADSTYLEIKPYKVADDSSYYTHAQNGEWDSLYAMGYHGSTGGGFGTPDELACSGKIFDLRGLEGDTISVRFIFASDPAYNTLDADSLFGLILDDILVVEGMDSLTLATLPEPLGGDTLFFEDGESLPHQMIPSIPLATGSWWWLAFGGYTGAYKAMDSDSMTSRYVPDMEDMLVSPKIARADLDTNLADLWLNYHLKGLFNDPDAFPDVDYVYNEYSLDGKPWRGISTMTTPYNYVFFDFEDRVWSEMANYDDCMRDLTTLRDSTWDTLQVAIHIHTDSDVPQANCKGFQVDDIVIYGRLGYPNDIGVAGARIPNPNANDVKLFMDALAVENYGFNTASSGSYFVKMTIVDSLGTIVDSAHTISLFPTPQIDPLQTTIVPLDVTVCDFTLTEEGVYDFFIWTEWSGITDDDPSNDTLRTEYTKGLWYPYAFNYPAGQCQLSYHDQAFYSYPSLNIRKMQANEVAAVHFTPESRFYPFDIALGLPELKHVGQTYNFNVYGPGVDDDHPGALWTQVQFTTDTSDELKWVRIELSDSAVCQHLSSDFWMGVEFPTGTGEKYVMGCEASDPDHAVASWDHSYLYWDPDAKAQDWHKYEYDLMITCVFKFRTVDAEAMVSESGPPMKNDSGNLYLDWDDVSQAQDYLIYRTTDVTGSFPLLDSTAVSNYTDADVVGTVGTNYYYLFHTRHQDGGIYDKTSKAVGEFDKSLLNAK